MRVSFKTIGCRLNQAETAQIVAAFRAAGWDMAPFGGECDVCVVHGCAVTQTAQRKSMQTARAAARLPGKPRVVLAGCIAELMKTRSDAAHSSFVLAGHEDKFSLPRSIDVPGARRAAVCADARSTCAAWRSLDRTRAWIKVQDGCDFACAYCIVPALRGKPWSRPFREVADEARALADAGFKEIGLTGANLGCYRWRGKTLTDLLEEVETIRGIERIRLSSIEISTVERSIADFMKSSSKLCRHLHLPLQSGDDRILGAMGRRYRAWDLEKAVEYVVNTVGVVGIGTDVITGFPGEDETAFQTTVETIRKLRFSNLHVFRYSRRSGTRAASMPDQVHPAEKKRRAGMLTQLARAKKEEFAAQFVGQPGAPPRYECIYNGTLVAFCAYNNGINLGRGYWTRDKTRFHSIWRQSRDPDNSHYGFVVTPASSPYENRRDGDEGTLRVWDWVIWEYDCLADPGTMSGTWLESMPGFEVWEGKSGPGIKSSDPDAAP